MIHDKRDLEHYRCSNLFMGSNYINYSGMGRDEEKVSEVKFGLSYEELQTLKQAQIVLERLARESGNEVYQAAADHVDICVDRWEAKP